MRYFETGQQKLRNSFHCDLTLIYDILVFIMARFSFIAIAFSLSILIIAGFLAFAAPNLNYENDRAEKLTQLIRAVLAQNRQDFSNEFVILAQMEKKQLGKTKLSFGSNDEGFYFRLTQITDLTCEKLINRFPTANIVVIENDTDIIAWHQNRSPKCYNENNKEMNAMELNFKK